MICLSIHIENRNMSNILYDTTYDLEVKRAKGEG
jgi:hypothetical protein